MRLGVTKNWSRDPTNQNIVGMVTHIPWSNSERIYSAGAALLDLKEPSKVLGRTRLPILEPEEPYERFGDVNNVVFPTGACNIDGELFLYYGGADKVCCLATAEMSVLLDFITRED